MRQTSTQSPFLAEKAYFSTAGGGAFVSIILPHYNDLENLKTCLSLLERRGKLPAVMSWACPYMRLRTVINPGVVIWQFPPCRLGTVGNHPSCEGHSAHIVQVGTAASWTDLSISPPIRGSCASSTLGARDGTRRRG